MKEKTSPAVKVFASGLLVLLAMLVLTGLLTYIIPRGSLDLATMEYTELDIGGISPFIWIFSPVLVLFSDSGVTVIFIILFLLIISGVLGILKTGGIISSIINSITEKFQDNEKLLISVMVLFFMSLGAFIGAFEEVVLFIPIILMLGRKMNWDILTSLSISILATGIGFSAAVTNPFTIGVAQELAGLPIFSGAGYRLAIFAATYLVMLGFIFFRLKRLRASGIPQETLFEGGETETFENASLHDSGGSVAEVHKAKKAVRFFVGALLLMLALIAASPFVPVLRSLSMPLTALFFLIGGIGAGLMIREPKWVWRTFASGASEMAPAILLILLATAIKHVMVEGKILDTILYRMALEVENLSAFSALLLTLGLVFVLNFFIGSGSAKAFVLMPVLLPLMDMIGASRQLGILAFQFGDGFSNVLYPTNAVLLISLSLAKISYTRWLKFILPLQIALYFLSIVWLYIGLKIGY